MLIIEKQRQFKHLIDRFKFLKSELNSVLVSNEFVSARSLVWTFG